MICTGEVPCLFNSLAKITNYVHVSPPFQAFFHFESWAVFGNGGTNLTPKQSNSIFLVNF